MSVRRRFHLVEREEKQVNLPEEDIQYIEALEEFTVRQLANGSAKVASTRHAGVLGLPSGDLLDIQPKAPCNVLHYLAYVGRIDEELLHGNDVSVTTGESFVEVVARLFLAELDQVLKRGLRKEYNERQSTEKHLRGQLDIQRQLQRQGTTGTKFECRFDEITHETVENKLLLDAIHRLRTLVTESGLSSDLNRYRGRLEQRIDHERMTIDDFEAVSITRLNDYYEDIIELAELVFRQVFIEDLSGLEHQFSSLLINMEQTFESLVYEGVRSVVDNDRYDVRNDSIGYLLTDGDERGHLQMEPDFYIRERDSQDIVFVGDAKWKVEQSPAREDLYQIGSYQAKFGTPGLLVYPNLDGTMKAHGELSYETGRGSSAGRGGLRTTELSTDTSVSYDGFKRRIESVLLDSLPERFSTSQKFPRQSI